MSAILPIATELRTFGRVSNVPISTEMSCPRNDCFAPDSDRWTDMPGGPVRAKTRIDQPLNRKAGIHATTKRVTGACGYFRRGSVSVLRLDGEEIARLLDPQF